ncbi:hypothetical protein AE32_01329 [Acinetobacter nosocomialis]|uniref:Uncharacterized protein n=2 Tax=Acinetobacter nosocomialis TaxID=106654 RepID=A0A836MLE6_ACINO|nr:hypothetical protein F958_03133 [Acinetobacter nosocomialis NIPH 386]EQN37098.1 hypothetical protein HMPREF0014_04520 [Acinetobacter sp. RUH 2624]KDM57218.1 hypothetical protein AE32_01329 [Acinetobacter nosocomialis]
MLKIVSNYNLKFLNYFRINLSVKIFLDVFFYKRILMLKLKNAIYNIGL